MKSIVIPRTGLRILNNSFTSEFHLSYPYRCAAYENCRAKRQGRSDNNNRNGDNRPNVNNVIIIFLMSPFPILLIFILLILAVFY